jgi:uncharacterized protein YdeI (YjbR/CyaY-like superfamily)
VGEKDPRVNAYIAKSADFAKPILRHLRKMIHANCPQVEETLRWGAPAFMYHGFLCIMAAFKQHCTFGFWHRAMRDASNGQSADAMGQFGRITSLADLPKDVVFARNIHKAMELNASGVKSPRPARPKKKKSLVPPADLLAALKRNKKALATFESFSPSRKAEYVEWIVEAKREGTRAKRLSTAIAWLAEGKTRNWKYERK